MQPNFHSSTMSYEALTLQIEGVFGVQQDTDTRILHSITSIFINYYQYLYINVSVGT